LELVRPDEPLADEVDLSVALDEIQPQAPLVLPTRDSVRAPDADTEQDFIRATALLAAGQVNDAIVALESASREPRRRFETASLLGRVFRERGDMSQAIEWLERAAEAPSPDAEASHAVLYELADTLEQAGETTRALAIYLEVQADRGVYRDVESRVERLMRSESGE
jgi:lipopolysaccharide biosynthesis regulator YciM